MSEPLKLDPHFADDLGRKPPPSPPPPLRPEERDERAARFALEADLADHHEDRKAEAAAAKLEEPSEKAQKDALATAAAIWLVINGLSRGTRWQRTEEELGQLIEASAPVVAKYMPMFEVGPEFKLLAVVGAVYGPTAWQWAAGVPWPQPAAAPGVAPAPPMGAAA